jgi:hypothetical protein
MFNPLMRKLFYLVLFCVIGLGLAGLTLKNTNAQESAQTLEDLFNRFKENNTNIVVHFIAPVAGETEYWLIPDEITLDNMVVHRTYFEIGADYFCVRESGEGARDIKCIPFSNVAEITFNQPN